MWKRPMVATLLTAAAIVLLLSFKTPNVAGLTPVATGGVAGSQEHVHGPADRERHPDAVRHRPGPGHDPERDDHRRPDAAGPQRQPPLGRDSRVRDAPTSQRGSPGPERPGQHDLRCDLHERRLHPVAAIGPGPGRLRCPTARNAPRTPDEPVEMRRPARKRPAARPGSAEKAGRHLAAGCDGFARAAARHRFAQAHKSGGPGYHLSRDRGSDYPVRWRSERLPVRRFRGRPGPPLEQPRLSPPLFCRARARAAGLPAPGALLPLRRLRAVPRLPRLGPPGSRGSQGRGRRERGRRVPAAQPAPAPQPTARTARPSWPPGRERRWMPTRARRPGARPTRAPVCGATTAMPGGLPLRAPRRRRPRSGNPPWPWRDAARAIPAGRILPGSRPSRGFGVAKSTGPTSRFSSSRSAWRSSWPHSCSSRSS